MVINTALADCTQDTFQTASSPTLVLSTLPTNGFATFNPRAPLCPYGRTNKEASRTPDPRCTLHTAALRSAAPCCAPQNKCRPREGTARLSPDLWDLSCPFLPATLTTEVSAAAPLSGSRSQAKAYPSVDLSC